MPSSAAAALSAVQFLEDMQAIEAAETWNRQIDQTYCSGCATQWLLGLPCFDPSVWRH